MAKKKKEASVQTRKSEQLEQQNPQEQQKQPEQQKKPKQPKSEEEIRESKIEGAFVKAVNRAGGLALKFTSQSMNGVPDRLILFKIGKCAFVELKAPGKQMRPLQKKRRRQLENLGFPVFCVDDFDQIDSVVQALQEWNPGEPFPTNVGAVIPDIEDMNLPEETIMPDKADSEQVEQAWEQEKQAEQVEQEKPQKNQQLQQKEAESEKPDQGKSKGGDAT